MALAAKRGGRGRGMGCSSISTILWAIASAALTGTRTSAGRISGIPPAAVAEFQARDLGGEGVAQSTLARDDPVEVRAPGACVVRRANQCAVVFFAGECRGVHHQGSRRGNAQSPARIEGG